MPDVADVPNLKDELHRKLQESRAAMLAKLDSLSEYDLRRPMTQPTAGGLRGGVPRELSASGRREAGGASEHG